MKVNLKKQQMQNEYFREIEHENQLLMKKVRIFCKPLRTSPMTIK